MLAAGLTVFELARVRGTSVEMIERHYGARLDGSGASMQVAGMAGPLTRTSELPSDLVQAAGQTHLLPDADAKLADALGAGYDATAPDQSTVKLRDVSQK